MTQITEKAMLVRLHIKQWSARKNDKKVTHKVEQTYKAQNAGRFNKRLVAEEAIKKVAKTANEARKFHYDNTLPWGDDGTRILLAKNYLPYTGKIQELKSGFEVTVNEFIANYGALVEEARERLKGMFDPRDYPDESRIQRKYAFGVSIDPLPSEADFRVTLQGEEVERIREQIKTRNESAYQEAMADVWQRLYRSVKHMADRLQEADGVFRNTLVNNLCDLCALLPRLNLSDSQELEEMRRTVEKKLCRYAPQELREDQNKRSRVANDATAILDVMKGYMDHG